MRVLLLSSAQSVHTVRWANSLASKGVEIVLVSIHDLVEPLSDGIVYVKLKLTSKLGYFLNVFQFRKIIFRYKPDIIHAHYAAGYGTLASISGFPYFLSVWGDDVYEFPRSNPVNKWLLKRTLLKANTVFSTSECMKNETNKYSDKKISVIPFGVDISVYKNSTDSNESDNTSINIGIVKVLAHKYGVDVLIKAFSLLQKEAKIPVHLMVVGSGPESENLKKLSEELNVQEDITFAGRLPNRDIPRVLSELDIFVLSSRSDGESFGVAAVEAGAAGLPCVVTNVGGLPEVVVDRVTGIVVEKENPKLMAKAIIELVENPDMRRKMGSEARSRIVDKYVWNDSIKSMISFYSRGYE